MSKHLVSLLAFTLVGVISGPVFGQSCTLAGTWESYAGQFIINSTGTGTLTNVGLCQLPYAVVVTSQTVSNFSIRATYPGKDCSSFTEDMTYTPSCLQATGTFDNGYSTGDDYWVRLAVGGQFSIVSPEDQSTFTLTAGNFNATPEINYKADTGPAAAIVSWQTTLEYKTSGGKGAFSVPASFSTVGNVDTGITYTAIGGKLSVRASATIDGAQRSAGPNIVYITGGTIPDDQITNRLVALYDGVTPRLMTGIAVIESNYLQFLPRTLYGINAQWPHEAYDGGSHIGLMQMPVNQSHAWDWIANTADAVNLFRGKIAEATNSEHQATSQFPGLRALTDSEREDMALVRYGPYGASGPYYIPTQDQSGNWTWVINNIGPGSNPNGVAYANSIRKKMR